MTTEIGSGNPANKQFMPTKTQQASDFKKYYQVEAKRIMDEENAVNKKNQAECKCESRQRD